MPFILWMSAVAGLMILVVEVMVAAPIWIVAHALPEGDGMAGNQAKQGYMMYLSIIFRAPLMVVGFFASYIMIHSFSWLLGKSFMIFFAGFTAQNFVGPITLLSTLAIVIIIMVNNAQKLFGMTTHLPENVMRWIGGQAHTLGENQDESKTRAIFMASANTMRNAAQPKAKSGSESGSESGAGEVEKKVSSSSDGDHDAAQPKL